MAKVGPPFTEPGAGPGDLDSPEGQRMLVGPTRGAEIGGVPSTPPGAAVECVRDAATPAAPTARCVALMPAR
jgi:hypothetical protein